MTKQFWCCMVNKGLSPDMKLVVGLCDGGKVDLAYDLTGQIQILFYILVSLYFPCILFKCVNIKEDCTFGFQFYFSF